MTRTYWAKRGRKISGPHSSREKALAAFRAAHPVTDNQARCGGQKIMCGYGADGPWLDIQWHDAIKDA